MKKNKIREWLHARRGRRLRTSALGGRQGTGGARGGPARFGGGVGAIWWSGRADLQTVITAGKEEKSGEVGTGAQGTKRARGGLRSKKGVRRS